MNIIDIIVKKKNKEILTYDEIKYTVDNFIGGEVKDYQMSSLLMAIVLNGMSEEEIFNLTKIMLDSGDKIDLSKISSLMLVSSKSKIKINSSLDELVIEL